MLNHKIPMKLLSMTLLITLSAPCHLYANEKLNTTPFAMPDSTLWLEIVINGKPSGQLLSVDYHDGHYWLTAEQLDKIGLSILKKNTNEPLAIDQIDSITTTYNTELQQLLINVPTAWLPTQHFAANNIVSQTEPQSSLGILMNYDAYATLPQHNSAKTLSLWIEQRMFNHLGVLSNTGIYRKTFDGPANKNHDNRYLRYDTRWSFNDEKSMIRYTVGDIISGALSWSSAIRLGGIQLARNFSTRPDLVTYPLPEFAGSSAVPDTVDLYINNYKAGSQQVDPGPFTIETQPFINGAGKATIVTTDALGRKVSTDIPFYVTGELLAKGLTDYSFSAGAIRRHYGLKPTDYGTLAASGVISHGLHNWLTLEGRLEGAKHSISSGIGTNLRIGTFGVLNVSVSGSRANDNLDKKVTLPTDGKQVVMGYSYNNQLFSLNAQRTIRSKGYADLSTYKSSYHPSRRQDQLTGSINLNKFGNFGAGYFAVHDALNNKTRLFNLSWGKSLGYNTNFYASLNKEMSNHRYSSQFTLTIPLGKWGVSTLSSSRDTNKDWTTRANWSQAVSSDGGFGMNLAYAKHHNNNHDYLQADTTWRSDHFELKGGIYGQSHQFIPWVNMTGAIVAMNRDLYTTNTINDAFALVHTNGFADIPIFHENQLIGKTNHKGYFLVPSATAWYPTQLEIEPSSLPADTEIPQIIKKVSIREQSGLLVDFGIQRVNPVSFTLVDQQGHPLPKGSVINNLGDNQKNWVGTEGFVWLKNIDIDTTFTVLRADNGQQCQFRLPANKKSIVYADKQVCQ